MLTFFQTDYSRCPAFLPPDLDTQRAHRHLDLIKAQLFLAGVAYCVAGKVEGAHRLCLVIESVQPDARLLRPSNFPVPVDGAGGLPIG